MRAQKGVLRVHVQRGIHLAAADHGMFQSGKSDPFVIVTAWGQEKKTKVVQIKTQMLSDFETLCAEMKTPEKITWCTTTQLFDGAHGASSMCRAAADAGCPRAG